METILEAKDGRLWITLAGTIPGNESPCMLALHLVELRRDDIAGDVAALMPPN